MSEVLVATLVWTAATAFLEQNRATYDDSEERN
jgi:hypothetical protein